MRTFDAAPLAYVFVPIALFIGLLVVCVVISITTIYIIKRVKARREKELVVKCEEEKDANGSRDDINPGK